MSKAEAKNKRPSLSEVQVKVVRQLMKATAAATAQLSPL